jgi:hypothetical protein
VYLEAKIIVDFFGRPVGKLIDFHNVRHFTSGVFGIMFINDSDILFEIVVTIVLILHRFVFFVVACL